MLGDLLAWRDARLEQAEVGYWRTASGEEVDFVVEAGGRLLPIEVKAGLLLHTGGTLEWLTPDVLAAPHGPARPRGVGVPPRRARIGRDVAQPRSPDGSLRSLLEPPLTPAERRTAGIEGWILGVA